MSKAGVHVHWAAAATGHAGDHRRPVVVSMLGPRREAQERFEQPGSCWALGRWRDPAGVLAREVVEAETLLQGYLSTGSCGQGWESGLKLSGDRDVAEPGTPVTSRSLHLVTRRRWRCCDASVVWRHRWCVPPDGRLFSC